MKQLILALFVALLFAIPAQASSHQVVSYKAEVATSIDPYDYNSQVSVGHYNDTVASCHAGQVKVNAYVVSDPAYSVASYDQVVKMVGVQQVSTQQVRVIVRRGIFARLGFRGFNETVVNCVQSTKSGNQVQVVVVRRNRFFGFLAGVNARNVKVAVAACR